jgi:hypothetical protein
MIPELKTYLFLICLLYHPSMTMYLILISMNQTVYELRGSPVMLSIDITNELSNLTYHPISQFDPSKLQMPILQEELSPMRLSTDRQFYTTTTSKSTHSYCIVENFMYI